MEDTLYSRFRVPSKTVACVVLVDFLYEARKGEEWRALINHELRELYEDPDIVATIKWLGYIIRMRNGRGARENLKGSRRKGWRKFVEKNMREMRVRGWRRKVLDRDGQHGP